MLEVDGVVKHFGGVPAVDGASLAVEQGSITALIGPNGAGKSSLFNLLTGFLRPERGTVAFEGRRIDRLPPHRIAHRGLVRTFQTARALTRMSVLENMLLAAPQQPGERKLLDFGRVLMAEPRLVLLDEPLAGVNPTLGAELLEHVLALRAEHGLTFLVIEHDLEAVLRASDTVVVMNAGKVIAAGTPEQVRADERVVDAYLGAHAP
jgi:neutral amino acid transport system ATP-binding protein